jgi:hypothetical protein
VVDPTTNTFFLRNENSSGAADAGQFQFGLPGWLPIAGKWGFSGASSVGVFDPVTATFYLRASATDSTVISTFQFGFPGRGFIPVAGDWTGTGRDSVGLYDPATSTWYLRVSTLAGDTTAPITFQYGGGPGWQPVVGTWNPTPMTSRFLPPTPPTTVGVVDPTGKWYLRFADNPGAPDVTPFPFGLPSWTPLGGTWGLPPGQAVPANPLALALPLRATAVGPLGADALLLSQADLDATVQEALGLLGGAGVDRALVTRLGSAQYTVGRLGGDYLGLAFPASDQVVVSANGAGWGWNLDAGVASGAVPGGPATGREDLLMTVLHEMGHLAGLPDQEGAGDGLMAEFLAPGVRRTQALDLVFAGAV